MSQAGGDVCFRLFRSDQELRKFLSIHKGKNFVKTHRRDTTRYDKRMYKETSVV